MKLWVILMAACTILTVWADDSAGGVGGVLDSEIESDENTDSDESDEGHKPPNIVLVMGCSSGVGDISYNNPLVKTPNLEALARAGVILNNTYSHTLCTPSRVALLTGYYPHRAGLAYNSIWPERGCYLRRNFTTLAELLKPLGYSTHAIGKWHLGSCRWDVTPTYRGFDSFFGAHSYSVDYFDHTMAPAETAEPIPYPALYNNTSIHRDDEGVHISYLYNNRAIDIIENHDTDKPLFLYFPTTALHTPCKVPDKYRDMYEPTPTMPELQCFRGLMTMLDETVGNITTALKERKMWKNTLFLYLTDHGAWVRLGRNWPLRGGGSTTFEGALKSNAFVHGKMLKKTGYVNDELIDMVDLFPTLLTLAGGTPAAGIDGLDVWDTISKGDPSPRNEILHHLDPHHPELVDYTIRSGDYKLIYGTHDVTVGLMDLPPQDRWVPPPEIEDPDIPDVDPVPKNKTLLFNIADDPRETHDLSEVMPEKVRELQERAESYMDGTPSFFPDASEESHPSNFGGVWSPGWC